MKRQSGSLREVDHPPRDRSERKRAKLLQNAAQNNEAPAMKSNNLNPPELATDNNLEAMFDDINVYFGDAKSSTPLMNQNGMKNGSSEPSTSKCDFVSSPINFVPGDGQLNVPPTLEAQSNCELIDINMINDVSPTTASLLNLSEMDESNEKMRNNSDNNNEQVPDMPVNENMPAIDTAQENDTSQVMASTSKCDTDYFLTSFMQVSTLKGHSDDVLAVAADEEIVLSSSQDTTIKMWDPINKVEICNFPGHTDAVNALKLLTTEQSAALAPKIRMKDIPKIVISGSSDCSIRLWAIPSGVELMSIYTFNGITCLDYIPELSCVVLGTDGGKLEVWDLISTKVIHSVLAHQDKITGLKFENNYIFTSSADGLAKVWLIEEDDLQIIYTRRRMVQKTDESSLSPCKWTCLTHYQNSLYLGDMSQNVKILNWTEGRLCMLKDRTSAEGHVTALQSRQNILLSSVYDAEKATGAIQVWQLPSLTYSCTMYGDAGKISSLAITETNDGILRIVSGGTKLLMWDFICSKPAVPSCSDDMFFCKELEQSGEEELTMYLDLPSHSSNGPNEAKQPPASKSWKCIVM